MSDSPSDLLADKVRTILSPESGFSERRMFGGLCFMVHGHMTCGVTGDGKMMMRVGPTAYDDAVSEPEASPMDFTGKPLRGMVYIEPDKCVDPDGAIGCWIGRAPAFTKALPPKAKK